jgi:hypothetical protein
MLALKTSLTGLTVRVSLLVRLSPRRSIELCHQMSPNLSRIACPYIVFPWTNPAAGRYCSSTVRHSILNFKQYRYCGLTAKWKLGNSMNWSHASLWNVLELCNVHVGIKFVDFICSFTSSLCEKYGCSDSPTIVSSTQPLTRVQHLLLRADWTRINKFGV